MDRDGTLIAEANFLCSPEEVQLLSGAAAAVTRLCNAGYAVVVVTNQSGVARGYVTESGLDDIHRELGRQLALEGAAIDGIYACPHHPRHGKPPYLKVCDCRKPQPGLLFLASSGLGLALEQSTIIGDSLRDVQAGWNGGCSHTILVLTGKGAQTRAETDPRVLSRIDHIADSLADAVEWILTK